jgi:hypothetical protein
VGRGEDITSQWGWGKKVLEAELMRVGFSVKKNAL